MVGVLTKIAEVAGRTVERLFEASAEIKEKVKGLDKPLYEDNFVIETTSERKNDHFSELDKPLNDVSWKNDELDFKELTEHGKANLRENTHWPDKSEGIQGCKINEDGVIKYPCRNEDLAGKTNPLTGIDYEKRVVDLYGYKVEVVMPKFESVFDAKLPAELYEAKDISQFRECNRQLYEKMQENPDLMKKFTAEQIEQIQDGITRGGAPEGYTWHHDAETGKMQLVDYDMHADSRHTGGKTLWGGGNVNR